ncbi:MAG: TetR/AcrR family transcriptional regulator [Bacteroidetes bacterium]|nr:MAG: TetR/AcrR family transcriptional regulator [Bacteroidota bacterium]
MTEKQQRILEVALRMFAEHGYDGTSTSKIAREAGVSEGLIFRHFSNKEGLLNAIMEQGKQIARAAYGPVLEQTDPRAVLRGVLELPFNMQEHHFWRLLYALKWQTQVYDHSLSAPLKHALLGVFTRLNYADPEAETEVVLALIDGLATAIILRKPHNLQHMKQAILEKYHLG